MTWKRKLSFALLVALLTALLLDGLLWVFDAVEHPYRQEALTRRWNIYVPDAYPPGRTTFHPDPDILVGCERPSRFTINEFGFRSSRLSSVAKPEGTRRVFCLGGSTTTCLYLDDEKAWPEVLGQFLQKRADSGTTIDVINAGVDGSTTRDHIATLSQRIVPLEPDMVVIMAGWNEMLVPTRPDYDAARRDRPSWLTHRCPEPSYQQLLRVAAADVSQLFRRLVRLRRQARTSDDQGHPLEDLEGRWVAEKRRQRAALPAGGQAPAVIPTEEFRQNLRTLVAVTRAHGAVPVLVTQATILSEANAGQVEPLIWGMDHAGRRLTAAEQLRILENVNRAVREVAAEQDCLLIDLDKAVSGQPELFYDACHFNVTGAGRVAEILAEEFYRNDMITTRLQLQDPQDGLQLRATLAGR